MKEFVYIAHRGYCGKYPENTRLAFAKAHEEGFEGVEFDVHLTKDNQPVIIHDERIERTEKNKHSGFIKDYTLAELRKFDFSGEWKVEKQTIMTLDEWCKEFAHKFKLVLLELKTDTIWYKNIEEICYNILKPYLNKTKWLVQSFNKDCVLKWKSVCNKTLTGYLIEDGARFDKNQKSFSEFNYINPSLKVLQEKKDVFISQKLNTCAWTINTQKMFIDLKEMNKLTKVYGCITNYRLWLGEEKSK